MVNRAALTISVGRIELEKRVEMAVMNFHDRSGRNCVSADERKRELDFITNRISGFMKKVLGVDVKFTPRVVDQFQEYQNLTCSPGNKHNCSRC